MNYNILVTELLCELIGIMLMKLRYITSNKNVNHKCKYLFLTRKKKKSMLDMNTPAEVMTGQTFSNCSSVPQGGAGLTLCYHLSNSFSTEMPGGFHSCTLLAFRSVRRNGDLTKPHHLYFKKKKCQKQTVTSRSSSLDVVISSQTTESF